MTREKINFKILCEWFLVTLYNFYIQVSQSEARIESITLTVCESIEKQLCMNMANYKMLIAAKRLRVVCLVTDPMVLNVNIRFTAGYGSSLLSNKFCIFHS